MAGGINIYEYAVSNPVMNSDPSGLVVWKVRDSFSGSAVAGVGGSFKILKLESPCVDGVKTIITVVASGASAGGGISCKFCFTAPGKAPFQGSFEDGSPTPNPNAFNGGFLSIGANFQLLGFGGEFGDTVLGSARSIGRFTPALWFGTFGAELSGSIGTSTVTETKTAPCGCGTAK